MKYNIDTIDMGKHNPDQVRIMICQIDAREINFDNINNHLVVKNDYQINNYIDELILVAQSNLVKLIVFPELSIPEGLIGYLTAKSKALQMYIFAGTRYKEDKSAGYLSIGTMITPDGVYEFHKINPSPTEQTPIRKFNINSGYQIYRFINTDIGNFAITICADYMDGDLKKKLDISNLDLLLVPSFHNHSEEYHARMNSDIIDSKNGLYILYSNFVNHEYADGRSAIFGVMNKKYIEDLKHENYTDGNPQTKLFEFSKDCRYAIFDLDLQEKKPHIARGIQNGINVLVYNVDDRDISSKKYNFIEAIGQDSETIRDIDKFYVQPNEFDDIVSSLNEKNIVIILGDPGIGKTYTATKLLYNFYQKGYSVRWISSLKREEREIQIAKITDCEPTSNEIFYIEDPFGRSSFDNSAEIKEILLPLIFRFKNSNAKLIITSRSEVFDQFTKEILDSKSLVEYSQEINIRRPSYSIEKLLQIAENYIEYFTKWENKDQILKIFETHIKRKLLLAPYSIYNIIRNFSSEPNRADLEECISLFTNRDISIPYSEGIKKLATPHKIGLYTVYFLSGESLGVMQDIFNEAQDRLCLSCPFVKISFTAFRAAQGGYRISQLGRLLPSLRLAHPIIEGVMAKLFDVDDECKSIATEVFEIIFQKSTQKAISILIRFLKIHSEMSMSLYTYISNNQIINLIEEELKIELCNKMLNSKNEKFIEEAQTLLPIQLLIDNLYQTSYYDKTFLLKLKMLYKRTSEVIENRLMVKWENIFTRTRIRKMNPSIFANSLRYAYFIDNNLGFQLENIFTCFDIQRLFIMQKVLSLREILNEIFLDTQFEPVLRTLSQTLNRNYSPMSNSISKRYRDIIWKSILESDKPRGYIYLDDGAIRKAYKRANIYLAGVIGVKGFFQAGDIVNICDRKGQIRFYTVSELPSRFIFSFKGLRTSEICKYTGDDIAPAIVSRSSFRSGPLVITKVGHR